MFSVGGTVLAALGRSDRCLSRALRQQVPGDAPPGPADLLGLELEFSVRSIRDRQVHFGSLIHRLALDGTALDPGDPNAYRCSWGGVITSDGAEAEIATPPVRARPGFTDQLGAWAQSGQTVLRRALPEGIKLDGYSAHLSAAMPARLNDRVCRLYTETFAAGLMMLMNRADSPGLLVRPRPGRTELCGEFTEHEPLAAAAAFVAGSARACAAAVRGGRARTALPPKLEVRLARAVHRYGWYVDRAAFGPDLHAASRKALLPRASGGTISAQSHLELAWAAARDALAADAAASDLRAAEAMVTGSIPLPAERGDLMHASRRNSDDARSPRGVSVAADAWLGAHVRPCFTFRPVAATWDFTVFEISDRARTAYACIPRGSLPGFTAALEAGELDDVVGAYLALKTRRRALSAPGQTKRPGLYDRVGAPAELLPPERDPETGRHESGERAAKQTMARPGKRTRREREAPKREQLRRRAIPKALVIAVALAVVLAGGGAAAAWFFHKPSKPPGYVSVQPSALSFPAVPVNTSASRSLSVVNNRKSLVTVTKILITGPAIDDFSLSRQGSASSSYGAAPSSVQLATSRQPPCVGTLQANRTCNLSVVFTPSAAGTRSADLEIYFASRSQPQKVVLTGIGMANGSSSTSSSPRTSPPDTPPALTLQSDQIIEATGPDGAVDSYTASASDAEDGSLVPACSPASDTVFPLGTTAVSCSVTDSGGKTTTGSFTVTVQDTTPPSLSLPAAITVPSFKPTVVTYPASATDLVDASVAVICTPESGSTFPLGMTTVDCSATDVHGNAATGSFTVTVTPPPPPA